MSKIKKVSETEVLEVREILRQLAKRYLNSDQKIRDTAEATGTSYTYLKKALLGEKYKGGLDTWIALLIVIARMDNSSLIDRLKDIMSLPRPFKEDPAPQSEKIFKELNTIDLINEDVKYKIAETLKSIITEMQNRLDKK